MEIEEEKKRGGGNSEGEESGCAAVIERYPVAIASHGGGGTNPRFKKERDERSRYEAEEKRRWIVVLRFSTVSARRIRADVSTKRLSSPHLFALSWWKIWKIACSPLLARRRLERGSAVVRFTLYRRSKFSSEEGLLLPRWMDVAELAQSTHCSVRSCERERERERARCIYGNNIYFRPADIRPMPRKTFSLRRVTGNLTIFPASFRDRVSSRRWRRWRENEEKEIVALARGSRSSPPRGTE